MELISIPLPTRPRTAAGLLELNRRDVMMLCGGGAMVLGAILVGLRAVAGPAQGAAPGRAAPDPNAPKEG